MINRRGVLLTGAGALCACATPPPSGDGTGDSDFRALLDRLTQADRRTVATELGAFDAERLSSRGRILYEAVLPGAQANATLAALPWGRDGAPYAVSHRYGAHRSANPDPAAIDRETERLEADAALGVVAPDFVLGATIAAVEAAARAADGAVAAALRRQATILAALRTHAGSEAGMLRLPDGDAFYESVLRVQIGGRVNARDIHLAATERCRELRDEADRLLHVQGLTRGSFESRLRALARDERYLYADSAAGKTQAAAEMNAALARVRPLLGEAIEGVDTAADVHLVPPEAEAGGAAGRRMDSTYFVDLGAIRARPRWSLASVAHHELVPGHMLQATFERAAAPAPLQRRYANAYSEAWAIYAEQLADDVGAYAEDSLGRIGYLQWMLFRMGRVVADTGVHAWGWSRAHAIAEMRALQGDNVAFVSIEDDVTRIAAQPGVYAAQGMVAQAIVQIRESARRAYADFTLRRFHAAVLRHGPLSPPGMTQAVYAEFEL